MKIAIRVDSSLQIGSGHVMRCLTLADILKNDAEILFLCRPHEGNLIFHIREKGFLVRVLEKPTGISDSNLIHSEWLGATQKQEIDQCLNLLREEYFDWMIVDHYALDIVWQSAMKKYYKKLLVIDDLGDRKHSCDVLLDQNHGSNQRKYYNLVPKKCLLLMGPEFALLREEFAKMRNKSLKRRLDPVLKKILINLGGVDKKDQTTEILKRLNDCNLNNKIEIIVVLGQKAPHLNSVKDAANNSLYNVTVKTGVSEFAQLMSSADLAIGAGGTTTWERCCLGLPTIQLVIAENQRALTDALSSIEALIYLDSLDDIQSAIIMAQKNLKDLSINSLSLVDGMGAKRVASMICMSNFCELNLTPYQCQSKRDLLSILKMRNDYRIRKWMNNKETISQNSHFNFVHNLFNKKDCRYLVLRENHKIIGTLNFTKINAINETAEFGLYANPFLKEKGRGEKLINAAVIYAKEYLHLCRLNLVVLPENKSAINLYKKFNFIEIFYEGANKENFIYMSKSLDK